MAYAVSFLDPVVDIQDGTSLQIDSTLEAIFSFIN
jgi:hypothetical protein